MIIKVVCMMNLLRQLTRLIQNSMCTRQEGKVAKHKVFDLW